MIWLTILCHPDPAEAEINLQIYNFFERLSRGLAKKVVESDEIVQEFKV